MKTYAIQLGKRHVGLLTLLNGGQTPKFEKLERYLLIEIKDDGTILSHKIVAKRALLQYDHVLAAPFMVGLR